MWLSGASSPDIAAGRESYCIAQKSQKQKSRTRIRADCEHAGKVAVPNLFDARDKRIGPDIKKKHHCNSVIALEKWANPGSQFQIL